MHSVSYKFILFAVLSSVLSSIATLYKVQGVKHIPPLLAAPVGVLFAGTITCIYLALRGQLPSLANLRKIQSPLLKLALCRSVFSNMVFTFGLTMSSGIEAIFLTKMEPYLVIFWVWLIDKKRPSGNHLQLLLIHIAGAVLLASGHSSTSGEISWLGDIIIVTGVTTAALSYRFAPQVTKVLTPLQAASAAELIGGIVTLPIGLLFLPGDFTDDQLQGWFYIGMHAILFYIFAISLLYASLNGLEGWLSSALRAVGPLFAAPIAILFFGESLTPLQLSGGFIVLITSAMISRKGKASG